MKIRPHAAKLLKDLEDVSKWESRLFCIKNKEHEFEVWVGDSFLFTRIWKDPSVKFNLLEKWKIHKAAKAIKSILQKESVEPFNYFKSP